MATVDDPWDVFKIVAIEKININPPKGFPESMAIELAMPLIVLKYCQRAKEWVVQKHE